MNNPFRDTDSISLEPREQRRSTTWTPVNNELKITSSIISTIVGYFSYLKLSIGPILIYSTMYRQILNFLF